MFQLSPGTLDAIEIANHYQPNDCLREVILRWLRRSGTSHSPPTWRRVVEVVGCPTGGNNSELARRIAAQHELFYWYLNIHVLGYPTSKRMRVLQHLNRKYHCLLSMASWNQDSLSEDNSQSGLDTDSLPDRLVNPNEYEPLIPAVNQQGADSDSYAAQARVTLMNTYGIGT